MSICKRQGFFDLVSTPSRREIRGDTDIVSTTAIDRYIPLHDTPLPISQCGYFRPEPLHNHHHSFASVCIDRIGSIGVASPPKHNSNICLPKFVIVE
jgi:hypothetical protein